MLRSWHHVCGADLHWLVGPGSMMRVSMRFYGELNDLLPSHRRQVSFGYAPSAGATVKHVVEALGVPHTEVSLILVDGESVAFDYQVRDGDRISVYPAFRTLDVGPLERVQPRSLPEPRFVLDVHLGRLAGYLRMLGFDAVYRNDARDEDLADVSRREQRILLTRDRGLLKRSAVTHGYLLREDDPPAQLTEVVRRFGLDWAVDQFTRCVRCNAALEPVEKDAILDRLQPKTRRYYGEFAICRACDRIYWKGSHYEDMRRRLRRLLPGEEADRAAPPAHDVVSRADA